MAFFGAASAASLDGTSSVNYQTNPYVFRDGDLAQGIVCFSKGFTVVPATNHGSNLFLDTNISISGGIDLRGTSTMTLLHDVMLDSGVTFSDSGRIYSYGSSLIMGGNLTIPADKVLHCGGNLIIDGNGNTLTLGSGAQLFLDDATTVTLRNMTIKTMHQFPGAPALSISSTLSKLALDNVVLALSDDFYVNRGQLFIHNDVMVTGTSALVYRSTSPSFITSQGCLAFDNGTTFSYAPACNDKDLIMMADASSSLVLDGCSLKTTHTGLRLTKGRLYMDNKVVIDSTADAKINTTTPITLAGSLSTGANDPWGCSWSPNGKYLAVVFSTTQILRVFAYLNGTLTQVGSDATPGAAPRGCAWSPDGQYIATANVSGPGISVFAFTESALTLIGDPVELAVNGSSIAWSPDGKFLVGANRVAAFAGTTPTYASNIATTGAAPYGCSWSPDGKNIAIVSLMSSYFQVFTFNGTTLTQIGENIATGGEPASCKWSPNGRYIAITDSGSLKIFAFSGNTTTQVGSVAAGSNREPCAWSPDGKHLAAVQGAGLQIYSFSGGNPIAIGSPISAGTTPINCAWSSDGRFVATVARESNEIKVFSVNYLVDPVGAQAVSNSIVWGNSAAGEAYDLDVHVLSGARVEVSGNIFHDPYATLPG